MKQYLVLHEDERFQRNVNGVHRAMVNRVFAGVRDGIRTSDLQNFMTLWLQAPLYGQDDYDASFWIEWSKSLQYGFSGVVLKNGHKLQCNLGPFDLIGYAFVLLRDQGKVEVRTGIKRQHCTIYLNPQKCHQDDTVATEFFDLPSLIQREVDAMNAVQRATGI